MSFLFDTNIVSEWVKQRPNSGVVRWLAETDEDRTFISVVSLAELRHGVERLPAGRRRDRLDAWLRDELTERFERRVLAIDAQTADGWGRVLARSQAAGRSIGSMDACIAALAIQHDLALVTRNVSDFDLLRLKLINPWVDEA